MSKVNNMGTYVLTTTGGPLANGVYTVKQSDGVSVLALKLSVGGFATITGSAKIGDFGLSAAQTLTPDEPTILSNPEFIDNLVITVTVGTIKVITNQ
jgi:hypothetical protein